MTSADSVRAISVEEAQALVAEGAQLVDVLPHETYLQEHLPGALNLPLAEIDTAPERLAIPIGPWSSTATTTNRDLSPRAVVATSLRPGGVAVPWLISSPARPSWTLAET